jgi:hypothetical protein
MQDSMKRIEIHNSGSIQDGIMRVRLAALASGSALLIPAALGLLVSRTPMSFCPFPALTVLPAFVLSPLHLWSAAVIVPPLLFFLWNPGLLRGESKLPKRSPWLLVAAIALSVIWFIVGWKDGLHYQGARHVYIVTATNVVWIGLLSVLFGWYRGQEPSFKLNLVFHWILFAWLAWYAFPYLGELP